MSIFKIFIKWGHICENAFKTNKLQQKRSYSSEQKAVQTHLFI